MAVIGPIPGPGHQKRELWRKGAGCNAGCRVRYPGEVRKKWCHGVLLAFVCRGRRIATQPASWPVLSFAGANTHMCIHTCTMKNDNEALLSFLERQTTLSKYNTASASASASAIPSCGRGNVPKDSLSPAEQGRGTAIEERATWLPQSLLSHSQ